jgi:dephospho-CoA kinase
LESATKASDRHIVITGRRSPDEVAILLSIPSFKLILVAANVKVRYERSRLRAREDHVVSFEEFKRRDEVQREMGVERIAQVYAPLTIANDGTLQDYERQLLAVVTE